MNTKQAELNQYLQSTLGELDRLAEQIRQTQDYSEQAEMLLCLREVVIEQIQLGQNEDSRYSTHAPR